MPEVNTGVYSAAARMPTNEVDVFWAGPVLRRIATAVAGPCPRETRAHTRGLRLHDCSPLFQMVPARRDQIPAFRVALGVAIECSPIGWAA